MNKCWVLLGLHNIYTLSFTNLCMYAMSTFVKFYTCANTRFNRFSGLILFEHKIVFIVLCGVLLCTLFGALRSERLHLQCLFARFLAIFEFVSFVL